VSMCPASANNPKEPEIHAPISSAIRTVEVITSESVRARL